MEHLDDVAKLHDRRSCKYNLVRGTLLDFVNHERGINYTCLKFNQASVDFLVLFLYEGCLFSRLVRLKSSLSSLIPGFWTNITEYHPDMFNLT